jgi:hypothetical protein
LRGRPSREGQREGENVTRIAGGDGQPTRERGES